MRARLTSAQAAAELGYTQTWVSTLAVRYGIGDMLAGRWTFSAADLKTLQRYRKNVRRGRPPEGTDSQGKPLNSHPVESEEAPEAK